MVARSVVVQFKAEAGAFLTDVRKMRSELAGLGKESTPATKNVAEGFSQIGSTATIAGAAVAAGVGLAIKKSSDFEKSMSAVAAATGEGAIGLNALRQAAIDAGADTQYSATEAADAITEMAKAGVSASDILGGGLTGALSLAAAGQIDVARAAEIAATALTQFQLEGSDLTHVADLFAAAAGKAQGGVDDIALAMKYAGVTANGLGISIEQTTGVLGLFASKGIIGEQAGTSFRSMLLSLTAPSKVAAKAMAEYGIEVFDTQGNFIGLERTAQVMQDRLGGLDQATRTAALGQIFGNEAIGAAQVLYEGGGKAVADWTDQVNDTGFAAEQAARLTDNLAGDVERLGGAFDTALIQSGSGANGVLRDLVQTAEKAVTAYGNLPAPVQQGALAIAALTAGSLLAVGATVKLIQSAQSMKEAFDAASGSLDGTSGAVGRYARTASILGGVGVAVAAAAAGFDALGKAIAELQGIRAEGIQGATSAILDGKDATESFTRALDQTSGVGAAFNSVATKLVLTTRLVSGGYQAAEDSVASYDQALAELVGNGNAQQAADFIQAAGVSASDVASRLPQYSEALKKVENDQTLAGEGASSMAGGLNTAGTSILGVAQSAEDAEKALDDLVDSITALGGVARSADQIESDFQAAIDAATEAAKENANALDVRNGKLVLGTEEQRNSRAALAELSEATLESAANLATQGASQETLTAKVLAGRDAFVKAAIQMGLTRAEANNLADQYGLIPGKVSTVVTANTSQAQAAVVQVKASLDSIKDKTVRVFVQQLTSGAGPTGQTGGLKELLTGTTKNADGGLIEGSAPHPKADNVLSWVTPGEVVMSNAAGDYWGRDRLLAMNAAPRYADGGLAGSYSGGGSTSFGTPSHVTILDADGVLLGTFRTIAGDTVSAWGDSQARAVSSKKGVRN